MSSKDSKNNVGILGYVFLIFLTLKLTHYIDWSWWWITAPIWVPILFIGIWMFLVFMAVLNRK